MLFKTQISDYNTFERFIYLKNIDLNNERSVITTICKVEHYLNNVHIKEIDKQIKFLNDNKADVPTGRQIKEEYQEEILDEHGIGIGEFIIKTRMIDELIGDYDIVISRLENGDSLKDIFIDLIQFADIKVDGISNLDNKCGYLF